GPDAPPPPGHSGEVFEPDRARPVPFCRQGLRPPPETSPRPFTLAVPWRWLPRWRLTESHSRCSFTCCENSSSGKVAVPFSLPSGPKSLAFMSRAPLLDEDQAIGRPGDRAPDQDHVELRVDS